MTQSAASQTILVVDDEPMVLEVVAGYLRRERYRVLERSDGAEAMKWLEANRPDLVVLDAMLPGVDGFDILRFIRSRWDIPVIMLTARADETDRVVGLELGADDYVVKPFSPRELAVRIRNVLRRAGRSTGGRGDPAVHSFDGLTIDTGTREVEVNGELVELTVKEFDLLATLAASPRQVFSRRQLLDMVWESAPEFQDPATVTVHVGRLRQKIESDPANPRWILTARGIGYRFEP